MNLKSPTPSWATEESTNDGDERDASVALLTQHTCLYSSGENSGDRHKSADSSDSSCPNLALYINDSTFEANLSVVHAFKPDAYHYGPGIMEGVEGLRCMPRS